MIDVLACFTVVSCPAILSLSSVYSFALLSGVARTCCRCQRQQGSLRKCSRGCGTLLWSPMPHYPTALWFMQAKGEVHC